ATSWASRATWESAWATSGWPAPSVPRLGAERVLAHGDPEHGARRFVLARRLAVRTVEPDRPRSPLVATDVDWSGAGEAVQRKNDVRLGSHRSIILPGSLVRHLSRTKRAA